MLKSLKLLSENLARLIRERGISQTDFAARVGVSPTYLNQVLKGKNASPKLAHLEKMADELGVTVSRLFAGTEDQPDIMDSVQAIQDWLRQVKAAADDPDELIRLALETKKK